MSGIARHHSEWLSLIEVSGPFLTLPVLVRVFPQGLPKVDGKKLGRLRAAYDEWANAQETMASDASAVHITWVQMVLGELLEFDDQTLRSSDGLPPNLDVPLAEHHETLRPSMAIVEPSGRAKTGTPRLLIAVWPSNQDLESVVPASRWAASPLERMTQLCRSTGVRLGLVTNGERWTVVDAPVGQTAGYASWFAGLWLQEPVTLAAFEALLGVRRFFAVAATDALEALLDESVAFQQEVTDQLGYQVRRAVEVLVQALDRADLDRKRELLRDVPPARLYDAALTVMMRLVFLFCAEERGLLLLGDETYDANYAVSTLRALLREEADRVGVEVLERRQDGWARLLANFRAVHGGIEHESLRLPALGGSLFDPDRFPFLEGRTAGTSWRDTPASPLPIDNRTVLHLLEALQLLRERGDSGTSEARKLSYRALDIEQIGHVYEGLLDHVAVRVNTDTLGLIGTKDMEPELSLLELDNESGRGRDSLIEFLRQHTGRSTSTLSKDLDTVPDETAHQRLLVACGNNKALVKRITPYQALLRNDVWGYPLVYHGGSFMVTGGPERRQTGAHYTSKSLTEQIVAKTLEPLVYVGPAGDAPRDAWTLRAPAELLDLKICDMAMGSGAFLVQACRWLAERVVEAWNETERQGATISADGEVLSTSAGRDLLPVEREERLILARRMVAERCIYGVDINPIAVELSKLSLWLVTLAKGRPFGYLDHNIRCGDSLLGIHRLDQLTQLVMLPEAQRQHRLYGRRIETAVDESIALRQRLRSIPIRDVRDTITMAELDAEARTSLSQCERIADGFIESILQARNQGELESRFVALGIYADALVSYPLGNTTGSRLLGPLDSQLPGSPNNRTKTTFHWPLEFPEVFGDVARGFDAIVGNPPWASYSGRQALTLPLEVERYYSRMYSLFVGWRTLHSLFVERVLSLTKKGGAIGLILPAQVADLGGYAAVRRALRMRCKLSEPLPYFGEGAFTGVVLPSCAVIGHDLRILNENDSSDAPFALSQSTSPSNLEGDGRLREKAEPYALDDKQVLEGVLARLENCVRAPPTAFADPGVHTGNCSKFLVLDVPRGICFPVREGRNVLPYRLTTATKYLRLDYKPSDGEYFTIRDRSNYDKIPILLRQTAARPISARHLQPTYFRNSVLACRGIDGIPHEAVVAWLNSSVVGYYHMTMVREANQKAFPQVKIKHLRLLPVPTWENELLDRCLALTSRIEAGDDDAVDIIDALVSQAFGLSISEHEAVRAALARLSLA